MYIQLKVEKQFGADRREQVVIFPGDNIVLEDWFDNSGVVAPNCAKITCHGLAYKVVGRAKLELMKALGIQVKELA